MQPFLLYTQDNSEITAQVLESLQSALLRLAVAAGGMGAMTFVWLAATWPDKFRWNILPPFLALWGAGLVVYLLRERAYIAAQVLWQIGLALAILLSLQAFQRPELVFALAVLPLLGGMMAGGAWAFVSGGVAVTALALAAVLPGFPPLPESYPPVVIVAGLFCGLTGWTTTSTLINVMEWSLYSYNQAQANLEEVRYHRGQLDRARKDLDHTNYLLERANSSLVTAWRTADAAERFKSEFVTNVSHELRTPLNLIIGFSEVMVTSPESYGGIELPGAYRSDIYAIFNSARHLLALVDDVLDLGRIDAGKVAIVMAEVSVKDLVGEVESMVREYISAKGLELQVKVPPDLAPVWIDRLRIRQVLLNLLVNAARFTEHGFVRLEVEPREDEILFRVQDTGRGITTIELPHVFDPFHSTSNQEESPWHSGTGLGLPISKKFIEMHRGQIGVETLPQHGSTFWFTLPYQAGNPASMQEILPSVRIGSQPAQLLTVLAKSDEHVVVVEGGEALAVLFQRQIAGFRFIGTTSLAETLLLVRELHAAALLVTHSLSDDQVPPNVPVITLPWPDRQEAIASLGAHFLLVKPVTPGQLLAAIDSLEASLAVHKIQRILIADSDPELVRLFRRVLRPRFSLQDLLEAYNGEEALERITADQPDLVILSLDLPGLSGREVIARMRVDENLARVPVILVSEVDWEDLDLHLERPLKITRRDGLRLNEASRIIQAILETFSVK